SFCRSPESSGISPHSSKIVMHVDSTRVRAAVIADEGDFGNLEDATHHYSRTPEIDIPDISAEIGVAPSDCKMHLRRLSRVDRDGQFLILGGFEHRSIKANR
ncbi:hypothetical protein KA005_35765, partial [bacterium]|nr:hypothetical protein [bacterium]